MSLIKNDPEAVRNSKAHLAADFSGRFKLPKRADNTFKMDYDSKMDVSPELEPDIASYFQTIIGTPRWMIKFRKIDIKTRVSFLLSCMVLAREGHLDAVCMLWLMLVRIIISDLNMIHHIQK